MKKISQKKERETFPICTDDENCWETVIDFTKYYKNGIPVEKLLKILDKKY